MKKQIIYKHSITKLGHIQVLRITIGKQGEKSNHRHVLTPGDDLTKQDSKSIEIAQLLWTPELLKLHEPLKMIPPASVKFWESNGKNYGQTTESQEAINIRKKIEKLINIQYAELPIHLQVGYYL